MMSYGAIKLHGTITFGDKYWIFVTLLHIKDSEKIFEMFIDVRRIYASVITGVVDLCCIQNKLVRREGY